MKELISKEGDSGECAMCGSHGQVLDSEGERFFQLTKALVRYYFSEWDYNHHWGGNGYESLFYGKDNRFFEESRAKSDEDYESVVLSITEGPVYEDYDEGVSIFAGYTDGMQNMLLRAVSTDLDPRILEISERLKTENHFNLEDDLKAILEEYRDVASLLLKKSMVLYRARVGFKEKKRRFSDGFDTEFHYTPYKGSEIGAPPPHIATSGRINRTGVSFLYCATEKYTAISEVRPHPGDRVSLAKIKLNSDAKVFDLSSTQLLGFFENDEKLDKFKPLNTLGVLINETIPPSERIRYSITQLIADCIRQLGFEGITFNSTVGDGKNIVLFDQGIASQDDSGAEVVNVASVEYKYRHEKLVNKNDEYEYD
ncbi:MAG: RES family NAD+ phosphorylase [Neobacillus sp.]